MTGFLLAVNFKLDATPEEAAEIAAKMGGGAKAMLEHVRDIDEISGDDPAEGIEFHSVALVKTVTPEL